MAIGLPIVASDIKPLKWLVSKDCGLFVNPRSPDQIAQALEKLLFDRSLRKQMGNRAKQRIANKFSELAMIKKTIDLYTDLLSDKARR
jgi:glycosyltransferase involved in cell wall biosynthesis